MTRLLRPALLLLWLAAACAPLPDPTPAAAYPLASFTESRVTVEIALEVDENGQTWLAAEFTPEDGYHLYSMDLPRNGVDGVGRPTLLELVSGSRLAAAGSLTESVSAVQDDGPAGLLVYPAGSVTLRLPVLLPSGKGWFDEQVSVTYMACRGSQCFRPVVGKLVPVRVPGEEEISP
jgi:hypothetical protein